MGEGRSGLDGRAADRGRPAARRTRGARVRRPIPGKAALARPGLQDLLGEATAGRRLTLVVAGAGFGKTTLLAQLAPRAPFAWYTLDPEDRDSGALAAGVAEAIALVVPGFGSDLSEVEQAAAPTSGPEAEERAVGAANLVADAIEAHAPDGLLLVLDDLHALGDSAPAWLFVETLVRIAPPATRVVLASRTEPPFALERLRGQGEVLDLGGPELAFGEAEVRELLSSVLTADPPDADELDTMARTVHERTGGWPAAVRLAVEAIRVVGPADRQDALDRLRTPGGPIFTYLAEEVVAHASVATRELVRRMSYFERFSVALCDALGLEDAERILAGLARRALFLQPISGEAGWYEMHALVREYVVAHLPLSGTELAELHADAAAWFTESGQPAEALRSLVAAGAAGPVAAFLEEHGAELVAHGEGRLVALAVASLDDAARTPSLDQLRGEAHLALGEWADAVAALRRAGGADERLSAAIAWRLGVIYGLRGAYDEALAIYRRADLRDADPEDEAFLHAFTASAHRHHGDAAATDAAARLSLEAAERAGRPRPLAAAHMAVGQALELANEPSVAADAYERALASAEAAGDAVQRARILTALGSLRIELGRYEQAVAALDEAVDLSRAIGFAAFHARALAERGRALWWRGQMEEGLADMAAGRELYARLDAPGRVFALLDEGELHLFRGDRVTARSLLENAVRAARESSDTLLGLCLAELGEVVGRDEPQRGRELLEEALEIGRRTRNTSTLSAVAYAYLETGDRELAGVVARETEALALRTGELPKLALAREVEARVATDPDEARRLIAEAAETWTELGAPFGVALNRLELARSVTGPDAREAAAEAERSLRAFGARALAAEAAVLLSNLSEAERPAVSIRTLGGFAVLRAGQPVGPGEWRSKKARDLLKILAARRGRPVTREQLFEYLWPDDDPEPLANRLSVALATVRTVLDPEHEQPSGHFVGADRASVWLEIDHVDLDIVGFFADVAEGRRLQRAGRADEAAAAFERAEVAYHGEFLEEDPYEDYAEAAREEAQAAYVDAARDVAARASARGDPDTAIRVQLRILEVDGFDERAHVGLIRSLIAAGRHGEARRRYGVFAARMSEIGVEAAPFPSPLAREPVPT